MYKVYVLKSRVAIKGYVGVTDNIERRIKEHNSGKHFYTRRYMPWDVIYAEDFDDFKEAKRRESFYKTTSGRRALKKIFNNLSK